MAKNPMKANKVAKIKSNDRMAPRTKQNVSALADKLSSLKEPHRTHALAFMKGITPEGLFELLHSMRRWYSGQTMARKILSYNKCLSKVMDLEPKDVIGIYRGFKVPRDSDLAKLKEGEIKTLDVTRNHGFSSWSTSQEATNKFSGGGNGKVGFIVKLVESKGITPVLAPPARTKKWFNVMYEHAIGTSFRPTEGEYLIYAPKITVEVIKVKK